MSNKNYRPLRNEYSLNPLDFEETVNSAKKSREVGLLVKEMEEKYGVSEELTLSSSSRIENDAEVYAEDTDKVVYPYGSEFFKRVFK